MNYRDQEVDTLNALIKVLSNLKSREEELFKSMHNDLNKIREEVNQSLMINEDTKKTRVLKNSTEFYNKLREVFNKLENISTEELYIIKEAIESTFYPPANPVISEEEKQLKEYSEQMSAYLIPKRLSSKAQINTLKALEHSRLKALTRQQKEFENKSKRATDEALKKYLKKEADLRAATIKHLNDNITTRVFKLEKVILLETELSNYSSNAVQNEQIKEKRKQIPKLKTEVENLTVDFNRMFKNQSSATKAVHTELSDQLDRFIETNQLLKGQDAQKANLSTQSKPLEEEIVFLENNIVNENTTDSSVQSSTKSEEILNAENKLKVKEKNLWGSLDKLKKLSKTTNPPEDMVKILEKIFQEQKEEYFSLRAEHPNVTYSHH